MIESPTFHRHAELALGNARWRLASGVLKLLAVGAAVAGAGCADPPGTLIIVQNQVPVMDTEAGATPGACLVSADSSAASLSSGVFDVNLDQPRPYYVYPLIQSRLPSVKTGGGVERNTLQLSAVRVNIKSPPGVDPKWDARCPGTFDALVAGALDPTDARAVRVEGFGRCHASHLLQLIKDGEIPADTAQPVFFGLELTALADRSGSEQKSDIFRFNVQVCAGCLQSMFPMTPTCADAPKPNPYKGNPCNFAQEGPEVLCCTGTSGALVCPAPDA